VTGAELEVWISEHQDDAPEHPTCLEITTPGGLPSFVCRPECPHPCDGGRCPDPEAHAEGAHDL
jgi:hypothetical protein